MLFFKLLITILLCASAILSCICWVKSALAHVPATVSSRLVYTSENGLKTDLTATAAMQSSWNRWAAGFGACAAICQAVLSWITYV